MLTCVSDGSKSRQRPEPRLDRVDDVDRVGARLALHRQHDRRQSVQPRQRAHFLGRCRRRRPGRAAHRRAAVAGDDQVEKLRGILDPAQRAQGQLARAGVDPAAGDVDVLPHQGLAHLHDRKLIGGQPPGLDVDLHGPIGGAGDEHLAHALGRLDDVLDEAIGEHVQLSAGPIAGHDQRQDRRGVQILLADDRRIGVGRQPIDARSPPRRARLGLPRRYRD